MSTQNSRGNTQPNATNVRRTKERKNRRPFVPSLFRVSNPKRAKKFFNTNKNAFKDNSSLDSTNMESHKNAFKVKYWDLIVYLIFVGSWRSIQHVPRAAKKEKAVYFLFSLVARGRERKEIVAF